MEYMEQFDTIQSAAATFQAFGCRGAENHYAFASDQVLQNQSSAYYGGGLVGYAISNAVQNKSSKATVFAEQYMFMMIDVTETGIGALAVKKAGVFKKWNTAKVIEGSQLFYVLYSDMQSISAKKVMGGTVIEFVLKNGATYQIRLTPKLKGLDYQEQEYNAIVAKFSAVAA